MEELMYKLCFRKKPFRRQLSVVYPLGHIFIYFLWKRLIWLSQNSVTKSNVNDLLYWRVWHFCLFGPALEAEGWLLGMAGYSCFSVSASVQAALILNHQLLLTAVLSSVCLIFNSKHPFLLYKRFFSLLIPFCHQYHHILDDQDFKRKKNAVRAQHEFKLLGCCAVTCSEYYCFHVSKEGLSSFWIGAVVYH